ncbi:hypothetical protein NQ176_g5114 [Zarea fungicola]|uniref:Uncharacterized protein n=1 Tax=Zarea fungicola TaxID=93591 RepID=A0ACC1NA18_9HYPO|nr:hypothetical protein NQ176_g5114 [Lecanicillium fungicola]
MPRESRSFLRHLGAGLFFVIIFVLTRLLHFGNLSENCLETPENVAHPNMNQYLVSPAAFFYVIKYPPDVAFWALTLGVNFFLLAGFREISVAFATKWLAILLDFGTTALFFYIVHLPVLFLVGTGVAALFGHETGHTLPGGPMLTDRGIDNIFGYFATLVLCLLIMWPLCRLYGRFKATKPSDSLWRFF